MNRIPVASSNIDSVGYDDSAQVLEIEFHSGGVYQYYDVPRVIFEALVHADSAGKFFAAQIKGSFRYARVA